MKNKFGWLIVGVAIAGFVWVNQPTENTASASTESTRSNSATDTKGASYNEVMYVERSFKATNATVDGYTVHNWSQINRQFTSEAKLRQVATQVKQDLGITDAKLISRSTKDESICEVYGNWPDATQVVASISSFQYSSSAASTILTIRAESYAKQLTALDGNVQRIKQTVTKLNCTPQISACINGFVNARMVGVQANGLISRAFSAVGAQRIEGVQSNLVTSISGYSSNAPGYIVTNGQKMNLQVAIHYDTYHNRTNVLVGTPIITETY